MSHPFAFRPGTIDEDIFKAVNVYNEYRLPDAFGADDVVLDVGTHIGSFCHAALARGAGRVHGFEADAENFRCAERNLAGFGDRVRLANVAAWRSDQGPTTLVFHPGDAVNTGGGNVGWADVGREVPAVPFDDLVRRATDDGRRRVRFLKIDCEGSEFPILLTSKTLHLVDEIAGEFHEFAGDFDPYDVPPRFRVAGVDRLRIDELVAALRRSGFEVSWERNGRTNIGMFYAKRVASPKAPSRLFRPHVWLLDKLRRRSASKQDAAR
ncbi:MAG TPA: FkbM family methyltransferase [Isosphaeraceae bacterium]|jgi:FkbM family methyltransferase|nr:FkbM family methyltransferase [Isosphaeraceae bacterium]